MGDSRRARGEIAPFQRGDRSLSAVPRNQVLAQGYEGRPEDVREEGRYEGDAQLAH